MRVLVTGGAGFIGSHVVDRLRAHGHEPVIFDLIHSPHHAQGEVATVIGDLADRDATRRAVRGCDAVIHLAAVADVNDVVADPIRADRINVHGTQMILEAARQEEIARVVYGSTVWVYGNSPVEGTLDEDSADRPAFAPLHGDEDRRRDVLQVVQRAVRRRAHDPALRHPVRPTGAPRGSRPGVRHARAAR